MFTKGLKTTVIISIVACITLGIFMFQF
ncbi:peptidoglycan-N-acetylglucosamine deacetylase, partial [Bacillus pseudomycoides]